jgi:sensor histidine kinase regulating citrate/malate metabolism
MEPVDICAILANQLDNAFEACQLIPEVSERIVTVHIWHQTERIVLFQVRNRVICDPFADNPELRSTKQDHSRPHGFGIKSIQETTAKYQGLLENTFQDGYFVSTVLLNCRPLENETRCPSLDNAQFI